MQVARKVGVFVYKLYLGGAPVELFGKAVAFGYLAVCFGEVLDGYRLGAVFGTYPVRVGQIDTDRSSGVAVACKYGGGDDFGSDTLYIIFLEAVFGRRVTLEPLCVGTDDFGAFGSLHVLEVYQRLPAGFHTERVAVAFDEAVYNVYLRSGIVYP